MIRFDFSIGYVEIIDKKHKKSVILISKNTLFTKL